MPFNAFNSIAKLPKKTGGVPIVNWVAVGSGNTIVTSADGITWRDSTTKGGISSGAAVAYGKDGTGAGLWVAVGPGIATSTDGTNWNAVPTASTSGFSSGSQGGIAYGKDNLGVGLWVACGNGTNKIVTSRNGTDWSPATSNGGITTGYRLAYNGVDKWVVCGDGSYLATSSNGTSFAAVPSANGGALGLLLDVAYGNGLWVAVGSGSIVYSSNGTNWTAASSRAGIYTGRGIAYGNGLWVVVGSDYVSSYQHALIAYSSNGIAWTAVSTGGGLYQGGNNNTSVYGVTYGNGLWVAGGGYGSIIATSTTGTSWNAALSNGGITTARSIASKPIPV